MTNSTNKDYAKVVEGQLVFAPSTYALPDGGIIYEFNTNEALMVSYGFKPVLSVKPKYDKTRQYLVIVSCSETLTSITVEYSVKTLEGMKTPQEVDVELKKLADLNMGLSEQVDSVISNNSTLQNTIETLTETNISLEESIKTLTTSNNKLGASNKVLSEEVKALQETKETLEGKVEELTQDNVTLREELSLTQEMVNEMMLSMMSNSRKN